MTTDPVPIGTTEDAGWQIGVSRTVRHRVAASFIELLDDTEPANI